MDGLTHSIDRFANASSTLSRRTVTLKLEMGQFSGDVARSQGQIWSAVEVLQNAQIGGVGDAPQDSEDISSVSSISASDASAL